MGMRPGRPVQLDGASGPLTRERSKAILERLESGGEETSSFDRHLALEQSISGSPLVVGNKVLLQDGPGTASVDFDQTAMFANARRTYRGEVYDIGVTIKTEVNPDKEQRHEAVQ